MSDKAARKVVEVVSELGEEVANNIPVLMTTNPEVVEKTATLVETVAEIGEKALMRKRIAWGVAGALFVAGATLIAFRLKNKKAAEENAETVVETESVSTE